VEDVEWFVPAVIIVAIELALALSLALLGLAPMPLFNDNGLLAYTFMAIVAFVRFIVFLFQLWRSEEAAPIARSMEVGRANIGRIFVAVLAVQMLIVQSACFNAVKAAIPSVNPFWIDPALMHLDGLAFAGQPWKLFYSLGGWATPFFDIAYSAWVPIQIISIFSVLLLKPSAMKSQAILSFVLAWFLLGIILACAFSSVGPIFYDRLYGTHAFVGLPLPNSPNTARESAMLWSSYQSGQLKVGSGISAMPSMHVALALWFALILRKTFLRYIAWAYVPIVWIGSVLLGWHYATDGLVGLVGMLAVWKLAPTVLRFTSFWRRGDAGRKAITS
jgi:hypothetical protein